MIAELKLLDNFFFLLMENPSPQEIINFQASEEENQRVDFLLEKNRESTLSFQETGEFNKFVFAERYMRMAKAKVLLAEHRKKVA